MSRWTNRVCHAVECIDRFGASRRPEGIRGGDTAVGHPTSRLRCLSSRHADWETVSTAGIVGEKYDTYQVR